MILTTKRTLIIAGSIIGLGIAALVGLQIYLPQINLGTCKAVQDGVRIVKLVVDLIAAVIAIVGIVLITTEQSDGSTKAKSITHSGVIFVNMLLLVAILNGLISYTSDFVARRLSADADATFQTRLNAALLEKNKELVKSLQPTLDAQKAQIAATTDSLTSRITGSTDKLRDHVEATTNKLDADISEGGNRLVTDLTRMGEEIKQADIPLSGFTIAIEVPSLAPDPWKPQNLELSEPDKLIWKQLLEARDKECAGAFFDAQFVVTNGSKQCQDRGRDLMFWIWTRAFQSYFDPNENLAMTFDVSIRKVSFKATLGECTVSSAFKYRCVQRNMMKWSNPGLTIDAFHEGIANGTPRSQLDWEMDDVRDPTFKEMGLTQGDIDSPRLTLRLCDPRADHEEPKTIKHNLEGFPTDSVLTVHTWSVSERSIAKAKHVEPTFMQRLYRFKATKPLFAGVGCEEIPYSYY